MPLRGTARRAGLLGGVTPSESHNIVFGVTGVIME